MAKKKESSEIAVTAFDIAEELAAVTKKIISQEGELAEGDMEALQQWQAALEVKAENIGYVKERLESEAAMYKALEEKARSHRKAREGAVDRLRKYLAIVMTQAGVKSIKKQDGLFSVSLCEGKPSARVDDVGKLPCDLVEVIEMLKPKTADIKARLEAGEEIPGASLERGEPFVRIV